MIEKDYLLIRSICPFLIQQKLYKEISDIDISVCENDKRIFENIGVEGIKT